MPAIIIYANDTTDIDLTINDIYDKTPLRLIDDFIICNDSGTPCNIDRTRVLDSKNIGRPRSYNAAAQFTSSDKIVFLRHPTKVTHNWLPPLIQRLNLIDKIIVSPVIHALDTDFWMLNDTRWRRFGWRWDMNIYDRQNTTNSNSPAASQYCMAMSREWFGTLGGFDHNMQSGHGDALELSIRSWLYGGCVQVEDQSLIGVGLDLVADESGLARIVEAWMPEYSSWFYEARGIKPNQVQIGRIDNLLRLREGQRVSVDAYLSAQAPELFGVFNLRKTASGKNIAVVSDGSSIDLVNHSWINRHDIIIGVDYAATLFDCDYAVSRDAAVVTQLRTRYNNERLVLPVAVDSVTAGKPVSADVVAPRCIQYEELPLNTPPDSVFPPFCRYDHPVLTAIQFALFLHPDSITVFGCDNKILGGKSHSANIEYYNGGNLWTDSDATRRRFAIMESGLDQLGKLARRMDIPLIRVTHA